MSEEMKKNAIEAETIEEKTEVIDVAAEDHEEEGVKEPEKPAKKEFFLIRGLKAVWRGAGKVVHAVDEFSIKHPRVSNFVSAGLAAGATYGITRLMHGDEGPIIEVPDVPDVPEIEDQTLSLPELEEPMLQDYQEAYEDTMNEVSTEEVVTE